MGSSISAPKPTRCQALGLFMEMGSSLGMKSWSPGQGARRDPGPELSGSQPERSSHNRSPHSQAQSRRARALAGAPRSRGVLLFLLHRARSLTSRGHCSQVGMGGCGQRPLQTASPRLTHLGSRLPSWEPRGEARPSRPAQHSRRVGRVAEPQGVTSRWPGPAATAGLGCNLGVVWRSGGSTRTGRCLGFLVGAPRPQQKTRGL